MKWRVWSEGTAYSLFILPEHFYPKCEERRARFLWSALVHRQERSLRQGCHCTFPQSDSSNTFSGAFKSMNGITPRRTWSSCIWSSEKSLQIRCAKTRPSSAQIRIRLLGPWSTQWDVANDELRLIFGMRYPCGLCKLLEKMFLCRLLQKLCGIYGLRLGRNKTDVFYSGMFCYFCYRYA